MCGRYVLYSSSSRLREVFKAEFAKEISPNYNIAPSLQVPIVRETDHKRKITLARWGLVPSWAKKINTGYSTINARAETLDEKPMFKQAFKYRRCLISADGFMEWQAVAHSKAKQPWFFVVKNQQPFAFAGLWDHWQDPGHANIESCTMIIIEANDLMRPIHDRMPVILPPEQWSAWLNTENTDIQMLKPLLKPYSSEEMEAWPISTAINNPKNNAKEYLTPLD